MPSPDAASIDRIVSILRQVPEATLRIFSLSAELIDADGEVREDLAAARKADINLAIVEAEGHARATQHALKVVRELN